MVFDMAASKTAARAPLIFVCVVIALAMAVVGAPLQCVGARIIAISPNHGLAEPPPRADEIRVSVGPPAASIAVEVLDVPSPRGTVFVLHGIRAAKEWVRGWGTLLNAAGLRAIMVDLRGHGHSTGDFMSYGVFEARDLVQVLDALESRGQIAGRVGAMGTSYGAATAITWAGIDPRVAAVVAVAPFASLRDVVPGYLPLPLPKSFADGCIARAGRLGGFDPDRASALDAIATGHAPVLLVHGTKDSRIHFSHSERLAAAAPGRCELHLVAGAGHDSIMGDPDGTIRNLAPSWFTRHLATIEN